MLYMDKLAIKELSQLIKNTRTQMGLSQFNLAVLSEVSLPTIQNIEGGKANPSLDVILKIFKALKMEIQYKPQKINWDCLAQGGVPLTSINNSHSSPTTPFKEDFELELKRAYAYLSHPELMRQTESPRNWEALVAYIWALSSHYPKAFAKIFKTEFSIDSYLKTYSLSKLIKLRRLALSQIKNY